MLSPSYLEHAPDALTLLWQQVEDDILRDVARRISKMETLTPTANWQLWRYQQTEAVRQDVVKKLAQYTGKSEAAIRQLMQEAATRALEAEDEIYYHYGKEPMPLEDSAALQALLNAGYQQTAGTFRNLTGTTANTVSGQFETALDRAHLKVSTGAFDYKSAVKSAVDSLADTMKYVTYPTGHQDTLEVAARRAVLAGVNQTAAKLQVARADEMGVEFFAVTAHGGARPSHAAWQGKTYHRGGAVDYLGKHYEDFESVTGYGTGAGLCGWNCRHTFFSVFPELGPAPNWTQESLAELNARDIEYNGQKYTRYEISQMQRARERAVRKWKRRYLAEDAAGSDTTVSAVKLRAARGELADFVAKTGSRADSARTMVSGFGRSASSKASYLARKQERFDAANAELQQMREAGIIKSTGKLIESPPAPNELIANRDHVFQRMIERNMTLVDCDRIIESSKVALSQWNGGQIVYYSEQGFVAVRSNGVISTLGPLDEGGKKLMEVVKKHGISHS
nr:MAG TPA: minor capsid protein [Caudoviricetes sp.]